MSTIEASIDADARQASRQVRADRPTVATDKNDLPHEEWVRLTRASTAAVRAAGELEGDGRTLDYDASYRGGHTAELKLVEYLSVDEGDVREVAEWVATVHLSAGVVQIPAEHIDAHQPLVAELEAKGFDLAVE